MTIYRIERNRDGGGRSYAVVGPEIALEFWYKAHSREVGGIETHSMNRLFRSQNKHARCEMGSPCWHTTLVFGSDECRASDIYQASADHWVGGFERNGVEWVYRELAAELARAEHWAPSLRADLREYERLKRSTRCRPWVWWELLLRVRALLGWTRRKQ